MGGHHAVRKKDQCETSSELHTLLFGWPGQWREAKSRLDRVNPLARGAAIGV